jgi:hypothetical protein
MVWMRGVTTMGVDWASGEVSDLVENPLNLVLYMNLRIFVYTSNTLIVSFEYMDWILTSGTLKNKKKKNPWLLGKMFEKGFPDASGREEGLMSGLAPGLGPVSDRIALGGGMVLLLVLRWLLVVLISSLIT